LTVNRLANAHSAQLSWHAGAQAAVRGVAAWSSARRCQPVIDWHALAWCLFLTWVLVFCVLKQFLQKQQCWSWSA